MTTESRDWAIARIRAKRAFWNHLVIYVLVNALLIGIWASTGRGYFWPVWPAMGWAVGVAAHAVTVFVGPAEISEERIERELQRR